MEELGQLTNPALPSLSRITRRMLKPSQSSVRITNSHVKLGTPWPKALLLCLLVPLSAGAG